LVNRRSQFDRKSLGGSAPGAVVATVIIGDPHLFMQFLKNHSNNLHRYQIRIK
jgi:hypothetical protein